MTNLDFGTTGAKRTSIEKEDPIKLLWEIRERHPSAGSRELLRKFTEEVKGDPDMLDVVIAYTFANLQHRIEHPRNTPRLRRANSDMRSRMAMDVNAKVQRHIVKKAEELLMDMPMPNGKRLGDCTISYCARLGGWMARIAKGKNPRQMVSLVYTEEDLKQLRNG